MQALGGIVIAEMSVCLSVSVTLWYYIKLEVRSRARREAARRRKSEWKSIYFVEIPLAAIRGVATGVDIGIYTPKISPSKLFMG